MKQPSLSDLLIKFDTLTGSVAALSATVHESVGSLQRSLEHVHRTLGEHSVALLELTTDVRHISLVIDEHSSTLEDHSRALNRIETIQRSETRALDDHERRITALEGRP